MDRINKEACNWWNVVLWSVQLVERGSVERAARGTWFLERAARGTWFQGSVQLVERGFVERAARETWFN
jgi:hypothetical protein